MTAAAKLQLRAGAFATGAACFSNQKQVSLGWMLYSGDVREELIPCGPDIDADRLIQAHP